MGDASSPAPSRRHTTTTAAAAAEQSTGTSSHVLPIRILTHNIRFATDTPDKTEKLWPERFPHLSSHFKFHTRSHFSPQATLVCMQEVLHEQLLDLHSHTFNTSSADRGSSALSNEDDNDWTYVGVGRDDGQTKGEYSPIFFRKSAWECVYFNTFWLNENGETGKKGWDAGSIRIATCTLLRSVLLSPSSSTSSPTMILAMNTHLDNSGPISRRESAKLILNIAARLQAEFSPVFTFLAGDLNSQPDGEAYQLLNAPGSGFVDTRRLLAASDSEDNGSSKIYALGNEDTFTGFPADPAAKAVERIDFVHLGIEQGDSSDQQSNAIQKVKNMVQAYGVLPNRFDDRVWLSDHRGVVVDLLLQV